MSKVMVKKTIKLKARHRLRRFRRHLVCGWVSAALPVIITVDTSLLWTVTPSSHTLPVVCLLGAPMGRTHIGAIRECLSVFRSEQTQLLNLLASLLSPDPLRRGRVGWSSLLPMASVRQQEHHLVLDRRLIMDTAKMCVPWRGRGGRHFLERNQSVRSLQCPP